MPELDLTRWSSSLNEYLTVFPDDIVDEHGFRYFYSIEDFKPVSDDDLIFGSAGVDGIEFRLRGRSPGVWAYYPSEAKYQLLGHHGRRCRKRLGERLSICLTANCDQTSSRARKRTQLLP